MHKLDMGLDHEDGDIDLWTIGENDIPYVVPISATWKISYEENGYTFLECESYLYALKRTTNGTDNMGVVGATNLATDESYRWKIGTAKSPGSGIIFYDANYDRLFPSFFRQMSIGETRTLSDWGITVGVFTEETNSQDVWWVSDNPSVASVNVDNGTVTAYDYGRANITVYSATDASIQGTYSVVIPEYVFKVRSYYDDSFDPSMRALIDEAVEFTNSAYIRLFTIGFETEGEPQKDNKVNNIGCYNATCYGSCSYCQGQKRDTERVLNSIAGYVQENVTLDRAVLWTNHPKGFYWEYRVDGEGNTVYDEHNAYGCAHIDAPEMLFMRSAGIDQETHKYCMAIVLAHEMAHTFGFTDSMGYNKDGHEDPDRYYCIMGTYQAECTDDIFRLYDKALYGISEGFCESCQGFLMEQITSYIEKLENQ